MKLSQTRLILKLDSLVDLIGSNLVPGQHDAPLWGTERGATISYSAHKMQKERDRSSTASPGRNQRPRLTEKDLSDNMEMKITGFRLLLLAYVFFFFIRWKWRARSLSGCPLAPDQRRWSLLPRGIDLTAFPYQTRRQPECGWRKVKDEMPADIHLWTLTGLSSHANEISIVASLGPSYYYLLSTYY